MVLVTKKQKTPSIQHRKRQGQHHKRTKDYEKSYWPFLPLLGLTIVSLGVISNLFWAPLSRAAVDRQVLSYATNTSIDGLLSATNLQRGDNSETALSLNGQLNAAAQAKANDMAARNYWSHVTPDGRQPWWFVTNAGYSYQAAGENLAYGFDDSVTTVTGWMNSPGHRANILNANYQEVGFGIASTGDYQSHGQETIVVALYGKPLTVAGTPPASAAGDSSSSAMPTTVTAPAAQAGQQSPQPKTAVAAAPQPVPTPAVQDQAVASRPAVATAADGAKPQPVSTVPAPREVSRLQVVGANLPAWSITATSLMILAIGGLFMFRHLRYLHRFILKGERYISKHPLFDIVTVLIVVAGILLTRTAGFIH